MDSRKKPSEMTREELIAERESDRQSHIAQRQGMIKMCLRNNSDRTHFILELLQNAEDAIGQNRSPESRTVHFKLTDDAFSLSHYGKPFDENDAISICIITSSTKTDSEDTIGKFGIGFTSVYRFTETPQISSGSTHHFEINESGYRDKISSLNNEDSQKTTIRLPFKIDLQDVKASIDECLNKSDAKASIYEGLTKLDGQTILFLRHITKIEWQTLDDIGFLERTDTKEDTHVRSVAVNSLSQDEAEHWLIFDRDVASPDGSKTTSLEIAFHQSKTDEGDWSITRIERDLCLSVYFPTREETHLGFHVQGGFETTASRESILEDNECNELLVEETGKLLVEALLWLRKKKKLDEGVLECLPIEDEFFLNGYGRLFVPVAERLVTALREKELLPTTNNGYCKASDAVYPSTAALAQLFDVVQLETLFKQPNIRWLSIQKCRPLKEVNYLKNRLEIREISTKDIINLLDEDFLKKQKDSWVRKFYAFLSDQSGLFDAIKQKPILRLKDGRHVCPSDTDTVYLPHEQGETKYDCVKRQVLKGSNGKKAYEFVKKLDLGIPDLASEALERIKDYNCQRKTPSITQYKKDLKTILDATKSGDREDDLYKALKDANIVLVDTADGKLFKKPDQVYLPTDDLKTLIGDKEGTLFVDETIIKKEMHGWMKRCGAHDHLRVEKYQDDNRWDELHEIAEKPKYTDKDTDKTDYTDHNISELGHIFCKIRTAELEKKHVLSKKLWDQMKNVKNEYWEATLRWSYHGPRDKSVPLSKLRQQLKEVAWVPDKDGNLKKPEEIFFPKDKNWEEHPNPFKNIEFMKSEVVEYFMLEGASEEDARELSKEYLTLADAKEYFTRGKENMFSKAAEERRAAKEKPAEEEPIGTSANSDFIDSPHISAPRHRRPNRNGEPTQSSRPFTRSAESTTSGRSKTSSGGSRPPIFIEPGDSENKNKTEKAAIDFVLKEDLDLIDANEDKKNNPGYDLHNKKKDKFIEVKGVSGEFTWVSMTITQFKCAIEKGDQYWLYVVEYAESDEPKLYKLHDLARSLAGANVIIKKEGLDWQE